MDTLEEYYGAQTFTLYSLFAVVPGKKRWPRLLFLTFSITLLLWCTLIQLIKLVIEKFKLECFIDLVPTVVSTFGALVYMPYVAFAAEQEVTNMSSYKNVSVKEKSEGIPLEIIPSTLVYRTHPILVILSFILLTFISTKILDLHLILLITSDIFQVLISIMVNDLRQERTEEESTIKRKYAKSARLLVKMFTMVLILSLFGVFVSGFVPSFLDLIIPLNQSREMQLLVNGEMFIDQKRYFCILYFVECCVVTTLCIVIFISENMSVIIGQHICGMFAEIGYRLENLTKVKIHEMPDNDYIDSIESRLHTCIAAHQKVLQYAVLINEFYDVPLTLVLIGCFGILTVSLVQVTDPQLFSIKIVVFSVTQLIQLFLVSYMGQHVIDSSEQLRRDACNAEWDTCSAKVRRLLQLIILRSSKSCKVVARGIYVLSIENFMSVVQTAISCFMVLRQTC